MTAMLDGSPLEAGEPGRCSVLAVDDHDAFRRIVRSVVDDATAPFEFVGEASSGETAIELATSLAPDLILMDVRMPGIGGVEASRRLVAAHPDAAVVMLTMGEDPEGVARAVSGGARGYVAKDASREEVAATVALALAAGRDTPASRSARVRPAGSPPALTEREQQVLDGMSRGKSNAEIGRELYLSEDTVKTHARRLFRKLAAADRAQAVALGFRWGFLR